MYVHFPSDVLAAAVLGVVIGELVFRYGNRLLDRHKLLTVKRKKLWSSKKQRLSALLFCACGSKSPYGIIRKQTGERGGTPMDIERTKRFYRDLKRSNLCDCAYCRNYVKEAAKAYPAVTAYLQTLGVDIAKPFETMPLELDEDGRMPYIGPQYLVFGAEAGFAAATVKDANDVEIRLAQSHPGDDIQEPHFVIEIEPIFLPWTVEETNAKQ